MNDILFFAAALLASIGGTIAGFGSSILFLPVAVLLVDFKTALVLVGLLHIFGNLDRFFLFRRQLDRRLLLLFGVPSVLFGFAGAWLVDSVSPEILRGVLGLAIVFFSIESLIQHGLKLPKNTPIALTGGASSGFFAGLVGASGPIRAAFLTSFGLKKGAYIATAAAVAILADLARVPVYLANGFLQADYYWFIPALFGLALAGSFVGKQVLDHIPPDKFRTIVFLALLPVGSKFIYDGLVFLFR